VELQGLSRDRRYAQAAARRRRTPSWQFDDEPKHVQMTVSAPDLSDTRAEVDSPSRAAATSVALRPGAGHVDDAGSGVPAAWSKRVVNLAGPATEHVAESRAANAGMVAQTIGSSYTRQDAQGVSRSSFLQDTAAKAQAAAQKAAKEGAGAGGREHLKGHVIERLDASTYNARMGSQTRCSTRGQAQGISPATLVAISRASSPAASG
jgi:hypothetical protein